jgi:hypothetical protein
MTADIISIRTGRPIKGTAPAAPKVPASSSFNDLLPYFVALFDEASPAAVESFVMLTFETAKRQVAERRKN